MNTYLSPLNGNFSAPTPIRLLPAQADVTTILRKQGPLSRTSLASVTGYSRAKITTVIQQLTDLGILHEVGDGESSGGRRPRVLSFRPEFGYIVGVDMGATSLDVSLANFSGTILERNYQPIDVRQGPEAILTLILHDVLEAARRRDVPVDKIYAFGLGVPGPVDFAAGMLIAPPIMPGWGAYPIREVIRQTFHNAVVIVDNDVNVMALGELRAGAGARHENFLFVKVGTGIGAGIISRGAIHRGADGCAGDIGHIGADDHGPVCTCGNVGCLEAIAAGPAIASRALQAADSGASPILRRFADLSEGRLTAVEVGRAAAAGDPIANEIIQESGRVIGEVLAGLVNFFNPSLILIGGGVSGIGNQFLAAIRRAVLLRSLPLATRNLHIDISPMGQDAGPMGALALALEHVFTVTDV